jgi:DNA repair protein RecN (Recombination protein N)
MRGYARAARWVLTRPLFFLPFEGPRRGCGHPVAVTANPGQAPRPLGKVASGGELSRLSLAIQVLRASDAGIATLVFDEVDAGIGGAVAEIVGRELRRLARERQVLCVTQLPQVASGASRR